MKTKMLIIGLVFAATFGANAAPKKNVATPKWNLSRADWSGMVSYYTYGSEQTYFGEQVYYGDENYGAKVADAMNTKYGISMGNIMGMCSKSGGIIGSYVKDGKQPQSHSNGDFCWCSITTMDGYTPWFLLSGAINGTSDFVKSNCAKNCAYSCAKFMYDYLYPSGGLHLTNAQELIEYAVKLKNN